MELSYAPRMGRIHSLLFCTSNNALLATTAASKPSWRPRKPLGFRPQGLAPGLRFSTGIRFTEIHQCRISTLYGFRLPIDGRRLECIGRASPLFRELSEEQNTFLCSGFSLRSNSSSRIFAVNSGEFAGGGVSAEFVRECEIHDVKNQLEDPEGNGRVSKQTGESAEIASSESPRTRERKTLTSSKGLGLSGDLPTDIKVEGKVRKSVHKFHSSSQTFSTRSYSKQTARRTYLATKTSSTTVTLQDTTVKSKLSAVEGPEMDNHRGQKRPVPVGKDGNIVVQIKKKKYTADQELRRALDMCSKYADAIKAIALYDKIVAEKKMKLNQYNFNVLLYLCASGASDALKPSLSTNRERKEGSVEEHQKTEAENVQIDNFTTESGEVVTEATAIMLTEEEKRMCLERGFKIYAAMKEEGVAPNEATFTAVARLAVAQGDGDLAFDMVKQMAAANLAPKLRSYGPALFTYCKSNTVDKAFEVDDHMQEAGVEPEESELEALLQVSVQANLEDKVYSLLHRLRKSVRELKPNTSEVIERWFRSSAAAAAASISSREEDAPGPEDVQIAIEKGGGGWHGLGWLGKGKWDIAVSHLDKSGVCNLCREKLVTIDIDPKDTDTFAESLSKLACQREAKNNEFKKFQAWLDQHGPFDSVVDGANVGLYGQNWDQSVNFHQLNAVVNLVQQRSPSKKAPLIILHHRRTKGGSAVSTYAANLLKKWTQNNTIYTTPTGSNDDWYWLYAAVKNKCLLVTDDEMRDHLFQLLGNDFFPKWKERHQVRFTITKEEGLALHMPPPYSIVIQESANGSWHIPKAGGDDISSPRDWLCITRSEDRYVNGESCSIDSSITETLSAAGDDLLGEITPKWASSQRVQVVKACAQENSHQSSRDLLSSQPKVDQSRESPQRAQFKQERGSKASSNSSSPTRPPDR